jgi:thiamine pyrophosphate-dependent acetolactate synthase large subunit-like protein
MTHQNPLQDQNITTENQRFGSDAIADLLRALEVPFLAINPGASFRGLHDSVVNHLDNRDPKLVLTLHEAQAVAMAHGYAKITGKPMGVVLHANVGLMNAVMAIFDAWADRVPMLILGATGAVDAARRRPWIEWIHTSRDQAAIVRPFIKWDDQPASVPAAMESILRAWTMTQASPAAPTYICLDVDLQESPTDYRGLPDPARFPIQRPATVDAADLETTVSLLRQARRPLMLVGRHQRTQDAWDARIALAERLGAAVLCDQKAGVGFPSAHPLFIAAPAQYPDRRSATLLAEADLILSLDWPDVKGLLSLRPDKGANVTTVIVSPDERLHNGWTFDHFALPEADIRLPVSPDTVATAIMPYLSNWQPAGWTIPPAPQMDIPTQGEVTIPALIAAFDRVRGDREVCLTRLTFGTPDALVRFTGPLDGLGMDGGGGIGSTPGITVGAALALKGTGRLPVAILGDGDLLMGSQALWTAAAERLPCLFIVNNNAAFFNDVEHQETVAIRRDRPVENKYIGMAITDPTINIVKLARSHGCVAFGPVTRIEDLDAVLEAAFQSAAEGNAVVVDVTTQPPAPRN